MNSFKRSTHVSAPVEETFAWHERPGAFERLTPPWEHVEVLERTGTIRNGDRVVLRVKIGPVSQRWVAEHRDFIPNRQFVDVQLEGPFAQMTHWHQFEPAADGGTTVTDRVEYELPMGGLGALFGGGFVRAKFEAMFRYRHATLKADLAAHQRFGARKLHVLLSGASGLIGRQLRAFLTTGGHRVDVLRRRTTAAPTDEGVLWNPNEGFPQGFPGGYDAVIHLAGEGIANRCWTPEQKALIRDSRVGPTERLAQAMATCERPPKVFLCASAIGIYGDRPEGEVDEESAPGVGFLAETSKAWEVATAAAARSGIRTVNLRIGIVLTPAGGALAKMLVPFNLGAGGPFGSGRQGFSWISIDDVIGAIHHAIMTDSVSGPVNLTAPHPISNGEMAKALGRVLGRPALISTPAAALKLALGEMAGPLLLEGAFVKPRRLLDSGYSFRHETIESALCHVLGRPPGVG